MVPAPTSTYSRWQVLRWEPPSDAQLLVELRNRFADQVRREFTDDVAHHTTVQYVGAGVALAPAAASGQGSAAAGVPATGRR